MAFSNVFPCLLLLVPSATRIWTLDLSISSLVFYHCGAFALTAFPNILIYVFPCCLATTRIEPLISGSMLKCATTVLPLLCWYSQVVSSPCATWLLDLNPWLQCQRSIALPLWHHSSVSILKLFYSTILFWCLVAAGFKPLISGLVV
jgi:hypothetical protein